MDNIRRTIYLAVQRKDDIDFIKEAIENYHFLCEIVMVKAPEIFQSLTGLVNTVEKYEGKGLVYVKPEEFMPEGIRLATKKGLKFGILLRNTTTGLRTPFVINQDKQPRKKRSSSSARRARRKLLQRYGLATVS